MDLDHKRLLAVMDRIAHSSTTKHDLENSAEAVRRLLKGKLPSELWTKTATPRARSYDAAQREIEALKNQIAIIEAEKATSEREKQRMIENLMAQILKLKKTAQSPPAQSPPVQPDQGYTRIQVAQVIGERFTKEHGVKKALVEKNAEQRRCGVDVPKIDDTLWQSWRKKNCYPAWAIEQLKELQPDDLLSRYRWSDEDKDFLKRLWQADVTQTNAQLAAHCSQKFGRAITDSSIRGQLHRQGLLRPIKLQTVLGD